METATIYEKKLEPLGLSIDEAARISGVGRSTLYEVIKKGALPLRKLGKRSIILRADLIAWLNSLPVNEAA